MGLGELLGGTVACRTPDCSDMLLACVSAPPSPACTAISLPACLAESRCQASHKKAMEAANEANRLAPLEPQLARMQDALQAAQAEMDRAQREVTAHQASIRWRVGRQAGRGGSWRLRNVGAWQVRLRQQFGGRKAHPLQDGGSCGASFTFALCGPHLASRVLASSAAQAESCWTRRAPPLSSLRRATRRWMLGSCRFGSSPLPAGTGWCWQMTRQR